MANNFCYATNWEVGNFKGDNEVDITDFSTHFLASFSLTGGGTFGPAHSMPEPSPVVLMGLGGMLLSFGLCRKRCSV